jgi:hypothetical protein
MCVMPRGEDGVKENPPGSIGAGGNALLNPMAPMQLPPKTRRFGAKKTTAPRSG